MHQAVTKIDRRESHFLRDIEIMASIILYQMHLQLENNGGMMLPGDHRCTVCPPHPVQRCQRAQDEFPLFLTWRLPQSYLGSGEGGGGGMCVKTWCKPPHHAGSSWAHTKGSGALRPCVLHGHIPLQGTRLVGSTRLPPKHAVGMGCSHSALEGVGSFSSSSFPGLTCLAPPNSPTVVILF